MSAHRKPATVTINARATRPALPARCIARPSPITPWYRPCTADGWRFATATVTLLLVAVLVHSLAEVWQAAGTFELSF
jgi:hypothetical protein